MLNRVILIGRLARDPELRYTPAGVPVGNFTVAVDRPPTQNGERSADFIDVVVWRKLAETCASHLRRGRLVAVEGRLQVRSFEAQDGQRRRVAEVVANDVRFLDRPRAAEGAEEKVFSGAEEAGGGDFDELTLGEEVPF